MMKKKLSQLNLNGRSNKMACDPDSGRLRELQEGEQPKGKEVLFHQGELIHIKGCVFKLENIFPNPENRLILKSMGIKPQEANMI